MKKALHILKIVLKDTIVSSEKEYVNEAIQELEDLHKKIDVLKEYVRVANLYIEFYRCKCGALGRVGYLCSNEDCTEE